MTNQVPTPEQVKVARTAAGITQATAAESMHVDIRSWQRWESGERQMSAMAWTLFLKLHPKTCYEGRGLYNCENPHKNAGKK